MRASSSESHTRASPTAYCMARRKRSSLMVMTCGVDHRPLAAAEAPTPLGDGRGADRVERHERLGRAL
eukprot:scaffold30342_cov53-Phaeocystis_antarctica.AAC.1